MGEKIGGAIIACIFFSLWLCRIFAAAQGLSLAAESRGYSLIVVTSLVAGHRLSGTWSATVVACKLSGCGLRALERQLNSCGAQA